MFSSIFITIFIALDQSEARIRGHWVGIPISILLVPSHFHSHLGFLEKKNTLQSPLTRPHIMFFVLLICIFYRGHATCLPPSTGR